MTDKALSDVLIIIRMLEQLDSLAPYAAMAKLGQALASPQRLRLLHLLAQCERPVEELAAAMDEPVGTTSHHLQKLSSVRLVNSRKVGRQVFYSLATESVLRFWLLFRDFAENRLSDLQLLRRLLEASRAESGAIDIKTLRTKLKGSKVALLDVRPRAEYEAGHIPGALSAPLEELPKLVRQLPKDKTLIIYCRGPYCLLAFKARELLAKHGIHALCLCEGPVEWAAANLPLERASSNGRPADAISRNKTKSRNPEQKRK